MDIITPDSMRAMCQCCLLAEYMKDCPRCAFFPYKVDKVIDKVIDTELDTALLKPLPIISNPELIKNSGNTNLSVI